MSTTRAVLSAASEGGVAQRVSLPDGTQGGVRVELGAPQLGRPPRAALQADILTAGATLRSSLEPPWPPLDSSHSPPALDTARIPPAPTWQQRAEEEPGHALTVWLSS